MPSRLALVAFALGAQAFFFGLAVLGYGDLRGFFAEPARASAFGASVLLTIVAMFSAFNMSPGRKEDPRSRRIFVPLAALGVVFAVVPAYMDRNNLWTLDGEAVRWLGLALLIVGGSLRVGTLFALGSRFSGLVAIQEHHELLTHGLYRIIRHPSYAGLIVATLGWALVFRSCVGALLVLLFLWVITARINAEERLLQETFGAEYAAYRAHTWRLVPWIY